MKSTKLLARKSFLLGLVLALSFANDAMALCGDVTGDNEKTATDALAVLQSAVGIPTIELTCSGEGPTDMRFYNPFWCDTGSSLSTARFNGFTFANCDTDQYTAYQSIDRSSIDNIEIDICGSTYVFPGPINLPPGRKMMFFLAMVDPAVYGEGAAMFIYLDDGLPAGVTANTAGGVAGIGDFSNAADVVYGSRVEK